MADDLDPLTQAMIDAGLFPEQMQQVQRQYGMGQQFMQTPSAQGAHVGNTYVASSPLEHASNAIRQFLGAKMAGSAMQRERDLTAQLGAGRQKYMQALQLAQSGGQAVGAPDMLARPPDPQRMQQLLMAGAGSADPGMQQAAHFGMQSQNLERQNRILENTQRHEQVMEELERQKVGQGNFESLKDMFGNPTSLLEKRTGKVLPLSTGGSQMPGLTQEARDMLAKMGLATGQVPTVGRGNAATATAVQIANQMAGGGQTPDLATNRATNKADSASLVSQQKILDNAESWERTGKANLNVLLNIAQGLHDTGSPWLNRPVRLWAEKGVGQPEQTAFRAAHATVVNEYAKILSGAQGSGAVTEGARHEAESMLPLDATWEQLSAAAKVLDTDAGNRIGAARQQRDLIKGRISGQPQQAAPTPSAGGRPRRTVGNETREWDGQKWVPVSQ